MGLGYSFFWNDKELIIELYEQTEEGSARLGDLRFNREDSITFAKKINWYATQKLAKGKASAVKKEEPTPINDEDDELSDEPDF